MDGTRKVRWLSAAALGLAALLAAGEVLAVVGRPLTPMSYAGVARRTARRSAYYGGGYYGAAPYYAPGAAAAAATAAYLTALPAGCAPAVYGGATYYGCGGTYYRPQYDGPNIVYVVVPPPQ
jgi:hypothetical protein